MTLNKCLEKAEKEKWAVGQFNISNLEILKAIILAAQALKSPVIIGTSEGESKFIGPDRAAALTKSFAREYGIPVFLNLDHGKTMEYTKRAIEAGYDAVHFDGSDLPFSKNIELTREVSDYAHSKDVSVEGELGVIGGYLTEPGEVSDFIRRTKIDRLAINIGTFHGMIKPDIDFERLEAIKKEANKVPLVMHGGSGTPKKDLERAISLGIVKINFNTELRIVFTESLKKALAENPEEFVPYKYMPSVIESVKKIVESRIKTLKSDNKI